MIKRTQNLVVLVCFFFNMGLPPISFAQTSQTFLNLPVPGKLLSTSPSFTPAMIKGLKIDAKNSLGFDFIVDNGDTNLTGDALKEESNKMIKYFLAALTVPEKDLWVNLSPYEKDKIVAEGFGQTEMGRDMLGQDYVLKQLTASLIYPESQLGKTFWTKVYQKAQEQFGTTNVPVNTFNKVWIVPDHAVIYEHGDTVFVVENKLKVMLEQDYLSLKKHIAGIQNTNALGSQVIREILIPEIDKEVNQGQNFATLRQIANATVLAAWYKQALKQSLLGKIYADKNKINGVESQDKNTNMEIYNQYLQAFKKGVYNYIKEDFDPLTNRTVPRKYFSGGTVLNYSDGAMVTEGYADLTPQHRAEIDEQMFSREGHVFNIGGLYVTAMAPTPASQAMLSQPERQELSRWITSYLKGSAGRIEVPEAMDKIEEIKLKRVIGANWKMEVSSKREVDELASDMAAELRGMKTTELDTVIFVAPSFPHLSQLSWNLRVLEKVDDLSNDQIRLGAQDVSFNKSGFTSEVSAETLKDQGVEYVIIGDADKRYLRGETNDQINAKVRRALDGGLKVILAIGEGLQEKEGGKTEQVLYNQLIAGLKDVPIEELDNVVIAYQPVWAMGTGKIPTLDQINHVHQFIRAVLVREYNYDMQAAHVPVQYGAMNKKNAADILKLPSVSGALVGATSTNVEEFISIVRAATDQVEADKADRKLAKPSREDVRRLTENKREYPAIVTSRVAAEIFHRGLLGTYGKVKSILKTNEANEVKVGQLLHLFQNLRETNPTRDMLAAVEMLKTRDRRADFNKYELKIMESAIKDTADGYAKRIFQRTAERLNIIMMVRASEGFGFGSRDQIEESFRANEVFVPVELETEKVLIQKYINAGREFYVSRQGKAYLISDINVDVIEGTNPTVDDEMPLDVDGDDAGGLSTETAGLGVRSLGNVPDGYMAQLFTNLGSKEEVVKFMEQTVDVEGKTYFLHDPELYSEYPEMFRKYLEYLAQMRGQALKDLEEDIVIMARERETAFYKVLVGLQKEISGLHIVGTEDKGVKGIKDGTLPWGLKAIMTREMIEQIPGAHYRRHTTMLTIGGSAEAFMDLGAASLIESAVGTARIYSAFIGKDLDGKTMYDHSRRYDFRQEEIREILKLRHFDGRNIVDGKKLFTTEDVKGSVIGTFSFLNNNQVFNQPGARMTDGGKIKVLIMQIQKIDGHASVNIISRIEDPRDFDLAQMTNIVKRQEKKALGSRALAALSQGPRDLGGINLDPEMYSIQIKRDGEGIPLPVDQQPVDKINISGIRAVIQSITPADLPLMLGGAQTSQQLAMSS